jgi:solute carrier family 25 phosphate transporter 23/24/25/41
MAAFAAGGRGKDSQPSTSSTTTTTTHHHHPRWNVRAFAQRGRTMVTRETEKMREKIREHNNNNKKNRTAAAVDDDDGVVVPRTRRKEEELRGRRKRRHPVLASVSQNSNIDTNTASTTTTTTTTIDADEDEAPSTSSKDDEVPASIGETLVTIALDEESGLNVITIITWDRQGLMLDIGNALNSLGVSVREVVMKAGADGFVESKFLVSSMDMGPLAEKEWDKIKERLRVSCLRRGVRKPWQERESRLRELFNRIDSTEAGSIGQDDLEKFAQSLRMPRAFVHEFISEASSRQDDDETGKVNFEEFAAFVRSKEIALEEAFDSLDTDDEGKITGKKMKQSLRTLTLRSGRNNTRKRIARKGIENMCRYISDDTVLNANDFRDLLVLIPSGQLETVTPYYMKVGLDIGPRRLPIPDKRKEGAPWGHLIAGGISGIVSRTVSSPLNVIAIRIAATSEATIAAANAAAGTVCATSAAAGAQMTITNGATAHAFQTLGSGFTSIWAKEGFRGFFKGNMASSIASVPGKAIDFFAYDFYKKLLTKGGDRDPENWERFAAGALAGMTSDTIMYPLDVISTRISLNRTRDARNSLMQMVNVVKETGLRGCYAGWSAAMIGVIPYAGISFGAYDTFKSQYKKIQKIDEDESIGSGPTLMCGLMAGWLASTVSYPLYYCTVRLQAGQVPLLPNGKLPRVDQLIVNTVRTCGWRDLFRGYLPSSLKLMPQAGFSFLTYELVQEQLEKRSKALSRKMNYDDNEEEKNDVVVFADVAEKNDSKKKN